MSISMPHHEPWTREDYERMVESGSFQPGDHFELVEGVVYDMAPQNSLHAAVVGRLTKILVSIYGADCCVRVQTPLALGTDSLPEPDFAIVPGDDFDYLHSHPTTAFLVVEVADSSVYHDRERKGRLYARSGIPELWIVNLVDRTLEVYRDPVQGAYRSRAILRSPDAVSPLSRPQVVISARDLLP
jgi:Uma2 family endonuclease